MKEVNYYIDTYTNSLLEDDRNFVKPLDRLTTKLIMDSRDYHNHVQKSTLLGRTEFKERAEEARLVVFNKLEFIQWLDKFKKDCEGETDKLYCEYQAKLGNDEKSNLTYLSKTGRLIGLFMEAERIERMINAINPINRNKPNYKKLDKLEAFDKVLIEKDDIPGFYSIPSHELEKNQKYQLENLKKEWIERLEWGKQNPDRILAEEFGKIEYHYQSYHQEFKWKLLKIRPRQDIKKLLNYHFNKFKYDKEIFIDHIDCRIKESLKDIASSNHIIYEKIIEDWVAEKRDLISEEQEEFLISKVYGSCEKFLDDIVENRKRSSENLYNIVIKNYINASVEHKKWRAHDQSMGGKTLTYDRSPSQAFRDIIIENQFGNRISALECLRIYSVPNSNNNPEEYIRIHVNKIFHNEPIGISPLFIIVYAEQIGFEKAWTKYIKYIENLDFPDYKKIEQKEVRINNLKPANLKVLLSEHKREMNTIRMYHFFINMNP